MYKKGDLVRRTNPYDQITYGKFAIVTKVHPDGWIDVWVQEIGKKSFVSANTLERIDDE